MTRFRNLFNFEFPLPLKIAFVLLNLEQFLSAKWLVQYCNLELGDQNLNLHLFGSRHLLYRPVCGLYCVGEGGMHTSGNPGKRETTV